METIKICIINGPNLNFLGVREPSVYGGQTLEEINRLITERTAGMGVSLSFFQSNIEGEIINKIHENE